MNFFLRLIIFIIAEGLGYLFLVYTERIVFTVGKMFWAEDRFGPASTYTIWKLMGIAVMAGGVLVLLGKLRLWGVG